MWFKLTYSLSDMFVQRPGPKPETQVDLGEGREIRFWTRTFDDKTIRPQLCCDAVIHRDLSPKTLAIFESLTKSVLPKESLSKMQLPYVEGTDEVIDAKGNLRPGRWVYLDWMPQHFQQQYSEWHTSLSALLESFVKTLRWIQAADGGQRPFAQVGSYWSFDKAEWKDLPVSFGVMVHSSRGLIMSTPAIEEVKTIWLTGQTEPLGHELIREALDVVGRNPRSGLLVGLSALETGLKEYIASTLQHSGIILEKLPSPPVFTILNEVIPSLHAALGVEAKEFPLNHDDSSLIKKWVKLRNELAHGVKVKIDTAKLQQFLAFARALLYTLDFYRDLEWSKPYMAREALGTFEVIPHTTQKRP